MNKPSEDARILNKIYQENFDPVTLYEEHYSTLTDMNKFRLSNLFEAFQTHYGDGRVEKLKVLDFGCATNPTSVAAGVAAGIPLEIVMSDFLKINRKSEIQERVRESIARVDSLDLRDDLSHNNGKFDVLLSIFCIDIISTTKVEFVQNFEKVSKMLKVRGIIMMMGAISPGFRSGFNRKYIKSSYLSLREEDIIETVNKSNLKLLTFKKIDVVEPDNSGYIFFLAASRK